MKTIALLFCLLLLGCSTGTAPASSEAAAADTIETSDTTSRMERSARPTLNDSNLLEQESIGGIRVNMPFKTAAGQFTGWELKPVALWGADGYYHQSRYLRAKDLEVGVYAADSLLSEPLVHSVTIGEGSDLETSRNVGIGSSAAAIRDAYGALINPEESNDSVLVVGSIYGGLIFNLRDGKAVQLFLGAAAE